MKMILDIWAALKKGILHIMSANAINKIISFLSAMVITRTLTQNDYGIWSYVLNIFTYLTIVSGFGLASGAFQYGTENHGSQKEYDYYKYCINHGLIIDIAIVVCVATVIGRGNLSIEGAKYYVISFIPILLLNYCYDVLMSFLRSQNRIKEYARCLNINSVVTAAGTCIGSFFGIAGVIFGRYTAILFSIGLLAFVMKGEIRNIKNGSNLVKDEIRNLWKYSIYMGICSALNYLVYLIDISMISNLIGDAVQVAVYKVGTLIPNALLFIPTSVVTAVLPNFIYHNEDYKWIERNIKKLYVGLGLLNLFVCFSLEILAPYVITFVSGDKYNGSIPVFRVLLVGYFFAGTFRSMSTNLLAIYHKLNEGLAVSIITGITDICLNMYFISALGMIGAAFATMITDIIAGIFAFVLLMRFLRKEVYNRI